MQIKKAVITAAGQRQRRLPLQTLVDRDGVNRSVLAILVNEIVGARIEEICVVVRPGDEAAYADAVPDHKGLLRFVHQPEARGYGDALRRGMEAAGGDACLHLVGDHLYVSREGHGCASQLVALAQSNECPLSAVRATHERLITAFGVVGGQPVAGQSGLYRVEKVMEKPTPTVAEQRLIVPGLRAGHYLAFFGMHVLTPTVLDALDDLLDADPSGDVTLSDALAVVAKRERYLALQVDSDRYDLGAPYGLLTAQIALALSGRDREEVLTTLVTLLADHSRTKEQAGR
jgi:UTP--glucose-1-phosphate uridylyltransferase